LLSLNYIKKHYDLSVDWNSSARILLSSAIAGVLTYAAIFELSFSSWIKLLVGTIIYIIIVVLALLLTRAIKKPDIDNLKLMIGGLGALGAKVNKLLNLIERIMIFLQG